MKSGLERLKEIVTQSAFYRSPNYSVNVSFKDLFKPVGGLLAYNSLVQELTEEMSLSPYETLEKLTPEFQRSNQKWTKDMQQCFVENLLCGCQAKVQLYDVKGRGGELDDSLILDGLQRLTAIASFHSGEFAVFDELYWEDLKSGGIFPRLNLIVNIYQFDSDIEACRFYIQMNKGITHSEADLETAYCFMRKHGEEV
ncbi:MULTISPECIES: hypothetical protein [Vibrio]|uniref:hypothetical protein n=1 Tax=Vibrio TaxID=662 RepID=UPI000812DF71|nr:MULTISPECIES: hypothetical protein [Vibrio]MCS0096640.1 DUF262 domain-containing protein [Vibrio cholerae]NOI05809.1 hypothetical protein [Vibrio anguillarum]OCQ07872.1 hypothetical protein AKH09_11825 [Vibrio parahaemolyticus]